MSAVATVLDVLLAGTLLALAAAALFGRGLVRGVVLFVAFGLVAAVIWVRLDAPDLALAEAAVGAGLTGALLLRGVRGLAEEAAPPPRAGPKPQVRAAAVRAPAVRVAAVGAGAVLAAAGLVVALAGLPANPGPAAEAVLGRLGESGVRNPVTAVLLVFRGYDTLLETAVLAAVVLGLRGLAPRSAAPPTAAPPPDPALDALVRALWPATLLVGGWLLWRGGDAPGGAFQAAAVLAAGLVVARIAGRWPPALPDGALRAAFVLGVLAFAVLALGGLALGPAALAWPEAGRKAWILGIEAGLTVSLAVLLSALVPGGVLRSAR